MWNQFKLKLKQIQEGDEKTKKRWIVIMSFLAMVIIIGSWIAYLNFAITAEKIEKMAPIGEKSEFDLEKEWQKIKEKIGEAKNEITDLNKILGENSASSSVLDSASGSINSNGQ